MGRVRIQYKGMREETAIECEHCRKLILDGTVARDFVVSGFDANGDPVDFCDISCAEAEGYEMCNECNLWFPKESLTKGLCKDCLAGEK